MGFMLELKLLLWKNFTLKRRNPVMFIFELLIPLVLFVVLVLIRRRKPAVETPATHYYARPLPSAGIMAVMQAFCDTPSELDGYGFPKYPNSTVLNFLTHMNTVGENYNFFEPGFTLDELQEVPKIYRSIIEDPLMLKEYFFRQKHRVPAGFLKDSDNLTKFMSTELSFNESLTRRILFEMPINYTSFYHLLFHNPNVSHIYHSMRSSNTSSSRATPSPPQATSFGEGFVYRYLRRHDIPKEIIAVLIGGKPEEEDQAVNTTVDFLQKALLDDASITEYLCLGPGPFSVIACMDIPTAECQQDIKSFGDTYCNLRTEDKRRLLLLLVRSHIDTHMIRESLKSWNRNEGEKRMAKFTQNIETVLKFKIAVRDLFRVSESMPLDYCSHDNTSIVYDDEETEATRAPEILDVNMTVPKRHRKHRRPFVQIWKAMQKTICGKDVVVENEMKTIEDIPMSYSQKTKLKLLVHVLYSNPKVLYVPKGTHADKIIQEANRTFTFFDTVTNYASTLGNVSEEIKSFLMLNTTERNLLIIRDIQRDMLSSPFRKWYITDGVLKEFIADEGITEKQTFVDQLDVIGIAACSWKTLMRGLSFNVFMGFHTEDEMLDYFKTKAPFANSTVLAGVVFYMNDDGGLPNHMIYKIRQNASFVEDTQYTRSQLWYPRPGDDPTIYYELGFIWLQDIFERAMINLYSGRDVIEPGSYLNHLPHPCYVSDHFMFMIQHVMALCLTVSWVYSVAMLVQHIVYEKEQRLKEVMKMMGMTNAVHWIAWFVSSFLQITITVSILTVVLKWGKVLAYSNPWIIFITMEIFAISIIMFSFLVSVLFSKAKIAAACAGILYFMSYVPYLYIAVREEGAHEIVSRDTKLFASFLAPTALGLAARYFAFYEEIGQGMQWSNIAQSLYIVGAPSQDNKPPSQMHGCTLAHILGMLLLDALVYLILFWYIENVHPGAFGIPKPWYFPFTKSYWIGRSHEPLSPVPARRQTFRNFVIRNTWWNASQRAPILSSAPTTDQPEPEKEWRMSHEEEPYQLPLGVQITKLCKKYKNASKYAVQDLSLNLYEGQITALLGPTGSGKTTIMSILTGLFPPSSGSATIYGHDIAVHMDSIRSSLGLCPQHNVLFDNLTVAEHIWFYSRLKQGDYDAESEAEKLIVDLDLPHKRHHKVESLSGGMKRRLSVAIAFVGGSKAVFMDEPTAGVDPVARRQIWDLILKYKKGRTLLLSTHHMDEAEILGDRIAIIENGQIKCCGSPLYLKHHLGDGYHLFIVKKANESDLTSNCSQQNVTTFIRRRVPTVRFVKESKHELHYMLSLGELQAGNFVRLFRELETSKDELFVSSYGVKNTTLEEIFMKVISDRQDSESDIYPSNEQIDEQNENASPAEPALPVAESFKLECVQGSQATPSDSVDIHTTTGDDIERENFLDDRRDFMSTDDVKPDSPIDDPRLIPKFPVWQQFCAIIKKRYTCTIRNLEGLISQILLPSFFVSVAMSVALTAPEITDLPEMILTTSQFYKMSRPDENVFAVANNMQDLFEEGFSDDASSTDIAETFRLPSGPGAGCVLKSPHVMTDYVALHPEPSHLREEFFDSMCSDVFLNNVPFSMGDFARSSKDRLNAELPKFYSISKERNYPICYCGEEKTSFVCPTYGFSSPEYFLSVTGDKIYDISGQNESQYYLYTTDKYRLRRYGGISLGLIREYVPKEFGTKARSLFGKIGVRRAAKVWYDATGYHSAPTFLNVLNNAILRANLPAGVGSPAGYGITLINHPWPATQNMLSTSARDILQGNEVLISIFIIVAMSFVPASFALFVVYERYTRSSHLQLLSGVHPMTYLTANYIWDVCNYFVPASFIVAILLIFDVPAYSSKENLPAVIALFLLYGWCISPVMHCASLIFKEPSSAYIFLIVINLFVGITCIVTSFLLEVFSTDDSCIVQVHQVLKQLFLVFPNYCLGRGLMDIAFWHYYNIYLEKTGQGDEIKSTFAWDITGRSLTAMVSTGLSFFIINFVIESKRFTRTRRFTKFLQNVAEPNCSTDEDVANEKNRVMRGLSKQDVLRVEGLTKVYNARRTGKHLAVDNLCFGVPPGECFGLLGVNSAGKSTTFKMLTGDTPITSGDAFINSFSVKTNSRWALKSIGYCPQVDALLEELTAREHLQLYARLRGVPSKDVDRVVDWALKKLDLVQYADRPCRTYSGGNRRKISTAIALIGSPSVIFLDEPTSGTDPRSRRFLWDLILSLVKEGRSIVFTSHSMEECEKICTRLAIMVQGQFRCIGSTQHLKNKFGDGYSLTLRCNQEKDVSRVERYIRKVFAFAVLKEKHHSSLHYEIASQHVSLDDIFYKMQLATKDMPILDYSVSQNTLDNVFINFVKNYHNMSNPGESSSASIDTRECTNDFDNSTDFVV